MTVRLAQDLDSQGMAVLLKKFPEQIEEAIWIGDRFEVPRSLGGAVEKIIFIGMGGSAIGGDVVRSLLAPSLAVPVSVSRHYDLPLTADSKTLCIFSSYSGNTEETLMAFQQGLKRGLKSVAISSGGELAQWASRHGIPWIEIPKGFPPRAALGYSVFPILKLLAKLKVYPWDDREVDETLTLLRQRGGKYGPETPQKSNRAKQLAARLEGRLVVIYAGTELLDPAALRFRNQIEENAKAMASHHLLPEMNHNEILGWQNPPSLLSRCACVFLRDAGDHARIQLRIKFTKNLIEKRGVPVEMIDSGGKSRLARLFSVIQLGDWVSYYLALRYRIDPTPVVVIESLKKELAKTKAGLKAS